MTKPPEGWAKHHVATIAVLEKHCHENGVPLDDIATVFNSLAESTHVVVARDAFIAFALLQSEVFRRSQELPHDPD